MDIKNIISSISYLDFINQINICIKELLYSKETGYVYLKSKKAIDSAKNVIEQFDNLINKLKNQFNLSNVDEIVQEKKSYLFKVVKKHYDSQIYVWADEVFNQLVDNSLFELSLDKHKINEVKKEIFGAINWLVDIKKLDISIYQAMLSEYSKKINNVLNLRDSDYLEDFKEIKTDENQFVKIWNSILDSEDEFLNIDLSNYKKTLSGGDVKYFQNIKNKLSNYKKIIMLDEIKLIKTAIIELGLKENKIIYDFISAVDSDFMNFIEANKNIKESDKISLIKRRMELFKDRNNKSINYFKQKLASISLNE